jgi:hypothetical protein
MPIVGFAHREAGQVIDFSIARQQVQPQAKHAAKFV